MRDSILNAIEQGVLLAARRRLPAETYQNFARGLRSTKHTHLGDKTVHQIMFDHATSIANALTGGGFSRASDEIDRRVDAAIDNIRSRLGF